MFLAMQGRMKNPMLPWAFAFLALLPAGGPALAKGKDAYLQEMGKVIDPKLRAVKGPQSIGISSIHWQWQALARNKLDIQLQVTMPGQSPTPVWISCNYKYWVDEAGGTCIQYYSPRTKVYNCSNAWVPDGIDSKELLGAFADFEFSSQSYQVHSCEGDAGRGGNG
jgi:hypothetical protein